MHIAILGWGSLLWDEQPEFDNNHGPWELDGPELKVEFSRVSQSRGDALTLVIDSPNGSICRIAHTKSKRRDPEDVIRDLRCRENTTKSNIGIHFTDNSRNQFKDQHSFEAIAAWAKTKALDVVVWTDLSSNFHERCGIAFSVASAVSHIRGLNETAKANAAEYVQRAPAFINTPLRSALQIELGLKL